VVLDGTDRFETRFAVNAACLQLGLPLVSGAVGQWSGQVGVFVSGGPHFAKPELLPCYRCWVPDVPPEAELCAVTGVIGALPGMVGAQMALQAIKLITGAGAPLLGRLWLHDGLADTPRIITLPREPACAHCS
jgi:molybdopterin-synthase adenylyltransferase